MVNFGGESVDRRAPSAAYRLHNFDLERDDFILRIVIPL
jgi:hypothetical protein